MWKLINIAPKKVSSKWFQHHFTKEMLFFPYLRELFSWTSFSIRREGMNPIELHAQRRVLHTQKMLCCCVATSLSLSLSLMGKSLSAGVQDCQSRVCSSSVPFTRGKWSQSYTFFFLPIQMDHSDDTGSNDWKKKTELYIYSISVAHQKVYKTIRGDWKVGHEESLKRE